MRRPKAVGSFFILVLLVLSMTVLPSYGQEKPKESAGFAVARLVVGTGVENSEPVDVAETFPASTEKVYCFLEVTDISKDTEISLVWSYGGKEMLKTILPLKAGPKWRTYANKNLRSLKGEWKVEMRGPDEKVLKEVKFNVK